MLLMFDYAITTPDSEYTVKSVNLCQLTAWSKDPDTKDLDTKSDVGSKLIDHEIEIETEPRLQQTASP